MPFQKAFDGLVWELTKLGATRGSIVVSTNIPLRKNGTPYATQDRLDDPGVAVYWSHNNVERVMACDRWLYVHENVHAIELAVEGMRAIERAGASQILERAFSAFGMLPEANVPRVRPWWEVFDLPDVVGQSSSPAMLKARYRELAAERHPDKGGTVEGMRELDEALAQALGR